MNTAIRTRHVVPRHGESCGTPVARSFPVPSRQRHDQGPLHREEKLIITIIIVVVMMLIDETAAAVGVVRCFHQPLVAPHGTSLDISPPPTVPIYRSRFPGLGYM